ncbi:hypothetical protein DFH06DRAFT_314215 [Mycena polygramma]|nr:hypothetical protein DFH06DRAFT_314215 [Mycena polygramma]
MSSSSTRRRRLETSNLCANRLSKHNQPHFLTKHGCAYLHAQSFCLVILLVGRSPTVVPPLSLVCARSRLSRSNHCTTPSAYRTTLTPSPLIPNTMVLAIHDPSKSVAYMHFWALLRQWLLDSAFSTQRPVSPRIAHLWRISRACPPRLFGDTSATTRFWTSFIGLFSCATRYVLLGFGSRASV